MTPWSGPSPPITCKQGPIHPDSLQSDEGLALMLLNYRFLIVDDWAGDVVSHTRRLPSPSHTLFIQYTFTDEP